MEREIHDIYDVILKIISMAYGNVFLRYIGLEGEIKKIEKTEIATIAGSKLYLDFLCLLETDIYYNIEFEFPKADNDDIERFFNYNITTQARHQKLTETMVFNFTSKIKDENPKMIGKSKSFHPKHFYLGDIDFEMEMEKIKSKVKSNIKLTSFDEITLMLMCLSPKCKNKAEKFKNISKILKKKKLFDETKFEVIEAIIRMEIKNLLSKKEQTQIKEGIKMTPQNEELILNAINEVNTKVLYEAEQKGVEKGIEKGIEKGMEKGKIEAMKEIAKSFKEKIDIEELSQCTGLSVEEIQKL